MKWKSDEKPDLNKSKVKTIFAFYPRKCVDGYTRWMCFVRIRFIGRQSNAEETNRNWGIFYIWVEDEFAYPMGYEWRL